VSEDLAFEGHTSKAVTLARCCAQFLPRDKRLRLFLDGVLTNTEDYEAGVCFVGRSSLVCSVKLDTTYVCASQQPWRTRKSGSTICPFPGTNFSCNAISLLH